MNESIIPKLIKLLQAIDKSGHPRFTVRGAICLLYIYHKVDGCTIKELEREIGFLKESATHYTNTLRKANAIKPLIEPVTNGPAVPYVVANYIDDLLYTCEAECLDVDSKITSIT